MPNPEDQFGQPLPPSAKTESVTLPNVRYFLDQDQSSHWYLVPVARRQEWRAWRDLDSDNEESWEAPKWAQRLDGDPSLVTFTSPTTP